MRRSKPESAVVTLRVPMALSRRLEREARRRRLSRNQMAREILEDALHDKPFDLNEDARRQSLLVSRRRSERETLRFILDAADAAGWT